jgi:hypothetical protein
VKITPAKKEKPTFCWNIFNNIFLSLFMVSSAIWRHLENIWSIERTSEASRDTAAQHQQWNQLRDRMNLGEF